MLSEKNKVYHTLILLGIYMFKDTYVILCILHTLYIYFFFCKGNNS